MIQSIGFKFDKAAKQWMAAFMVAASGSLAAEVNNDHYYELMPLEQIQAEEAEALANGDMQAVAEYGLAASAIKETNEGLRATPNDLPHDFDANLFTEDNQGTLYKSIDPQRDVNWTEYYVAQKTAQVLAEKVPAGTIVETIMADGRIETTKTAGEGGGYRVTNPDGEQYLVDTAKFEKIYDDLGNGAYAPKPDPRKVVDVERNVSFKAPWGEDMRIKSGGALVYGGPNDVYGIQPDEFKATYAPVNTPTV
ncbi:MAG: hypothetical protein NZ828_00365 [Alphaproteobacteria bacterium]|nr:hypothetical protein [Alphaproteobacteria bacterium]